MKNVIVTIGLVHEGCETHAFLDVSNTRCEDGDDLLIVYDARFQTTTVFTKGLTVSPKSGNGLVKNLDDVIQAVEWILSDVGHTGQIARSLRDYALIELPKKDSETSSS